jgi:hypothetical protein
LRASSSWRTSSARSADAIAGGGSAAGRSVPSRSESPPRPILSYKARGGEGQRHGDEPAHDHDDQQHGAERRLHDVQSRRVWRRLRRRTFAPRRPAVLPEQWGLILVTALCIAGGIAAVVLHPGRLTRANLAVRPVVGVSPSGYPGGT